MGPATSTSAQAPIVLIVEDEPLLRMMAVDMIEDAGFAALEAADGDEAVRILEARDDIRLVFTDIHMPGSVDGVKLANCIHDRWPPVNVILTSGHMMRDEIALPPGNVFVPKPYDHRHLIELLRQIAG